MVAKPAGIVPNSSMALGAVVSKLHQQNNLEAVRMT